MFAFKWSSSGQLRAGWLFILTDLGLLECRGSSVLGRAGAVPGCRKSSSGISGKLTRRGTLDRGLVEGRLVLSFTRRQLQGAGGWVLSWDW